MSKETNNNKTEVKEAKTTEKAVPEKKVQKGSKGSSSNSRRSKNFNDKYSKQNKGHTSCGGNDPSWYASNPALLRDAASIPFSWAVGAPIALDIPDMKAPWSIPGIMTMDIIPQFGIGNDPNSPLNLASTSAYSFIRHANSGHSNYDAPDLMIYIASMTQIYSYINWMQRVYGCATLYAQGNRYLPRALVECQGVDYDDVYSNLANFRYGINALIAKAASLAVPATMPIFLRHAFLFQNVYIEGPSIKDQMYLLNPDGFYQFSFDAEHAGMLTYFPLADFKTEEAVDKLKTSHMLKFGNLLLDALVMNEDINIMSGDILKAYGGNIIKLAPLPEIYPLTPVFNAAVLEQFKNATVFMGENIHNLHIKQNSTKAYLESQPMWTTNAAIETKYPSLTVENQKKLMSYYKGRRILSTIAPNPDQNVVIEDTRLMASLDPNTATESTANILCGSEIVVDLKYWTYLYSSTGTVTLSVGRVYSSLLVTADTMPTRFSAFARLKHFKYCPAICANIVDGVNTTREIYFDVDNFAILDYQTLYKMHETAILSMLNVASIAKGGIKF